VKLRGALLGAGNIALRGHGPQWAGASGLRDEVEIVAIADLSPANLEAARALFPDATPYARAEDLLEREALDFSDICTPPDSHRALVERAARNGVHVVCEKPLAPSLADAESIAATVREAGIVFQPCHQYHDSPTWSAVRALIPRIGRIYFVDYEVQRTQANPGSSNWSPAWRTERARAGGGILVDHGAHIFYQLRAILGEPRTVQATVRTLHHRYPVEDTALVVLDYGDCLARVNLTWAARRRGVRFQFVGERGELVGDDERVTLHAETVEEVRFADAMSLGSDHSEWYAPMFRAFTDRVRRRDAAGDGLEEAVYVMRLISKAYASSAENRSLAFAAEEEGELMETGEPLDTSAPLANDALALPRPHDTSARTWLWRGAAMLTLLAAGAWTFHDVAWGLVWSAMRASQAQWIAAAIALNLLAVGFQAARWLALIRPLSAAATLAAAFKAMTVGFASSVVLPARAGELARMHFLSRQTGLPRTSVFSSIVLDHLVNAAGLLLALALLPLVIHVPLWVRPGAVGAFALFAAGAILVLAVRPLRTTVAASRSSVPMRRLAGLLQNARLGLAAVGRPRALGLSFAAGLGSWALEGGVTAAALRAVGLPLSVSTSLLVLLAVNLALAFPLATPGNIGTLEVGATLALVGLGVPKEQALAFGIVYHVLQVVPVGMLGVVFAARENK
jgi:glycosyltransferase AglD